MKTFEEFKHCPELYGCCTLQLYPAYVEYVKKETAKEILQEVGKQYICLDECDEELYARDYKWFDNLCRKNGVEVK